MIHASHQTLRTNTANCLRECSLREQHQWRAGPHYLSSW